MLCSSISKCSKTSGNYFLILFYSISTIEHNLGVPGTNINLQFKSYIIYTKVQKVSSSFLISTSILAMMKGTPIRSISISKTLKNNRRRHQSFKSFGYTYRAYWSASLVLLDIKHQTSPLSLSGIPFLRLNKRRILFMFDRSFLFIMFCHSSSSNMQS